MSIRRKIFTIITDQEEKQLQPHNKYFESAVTVLIFLNVVAIILESDPSIYEPCKEFFFYFEAFSILVFTVEFLLRIWTYDLIDEKEGKLKGFFKFLFSPLSIIDILAVVPFYLPLFFTMDMRHVRILRMLRMLRVLKLNRYSKSLQMVVNVLREKRADLITTIFIAFILLVVASSLMYHIEKDAQPEAFPNIFATFWWAVATLTTVGYGDVYPVTGWGKLISGIIALLGIGLVALPTGILSSAFIEKMEEDRAKKEKRNKEKQQKVLHSGFKYCPHCGEKLHPNDGGHP